MGIQPKTWMKLIFILRRDLHFIVSIQTRGNLYTYNHHPFILDGHKSDVTINIVHKTKAMGLDIITLPSHTSHILQPLNVACLNLSNFDFKHIEMYGHWLITKQKVLET
jgi:hypothetical protein